MQISEIDSDRLSVTLTRAPAKRRETRATVRVVIRVIPCTDGTAAVRNTGYNAQGDVTYLNSSKGRTMEDAAMLACAALGFTVHE